MPVTEMFYSTYFFWLVLLLAAPVITMRLFALEKASGTFETLMTTPVSDLAGGRGEIHGGDCFLHGRRGCRWLACLFVVRHFTNQPGALDAGTVGGMYLGIFLVGCLFLSLGCFASAVSRSQMAAAMISFVLGVTLFSLGLSGGSDCRSPRNGRRRRCRISGCSSRCTISRAAWWTRAR